MNDNRPTNYLPQEIQETALYVQQILRTQWIVVSSWGYKRPAAIQFRKMKALRFHVNGFWHKGFIVVALNEGTDLFEVYKLDENHNVLPGEETEVYFDMLVDTIDRMVETPNADSLQYQKQIEAYLASSAK